MSDKKRINEILEEYWLEIKGDAPYPAEADVDPEALSEIWDNCFLVKVDYDNSERPYEYVYLGESLIQAYGGDDMTEKEVCETLIYPSSHSLVHEFKEVVDSAKPVVDESEFTNSKGLLIKYRSNLLPLSAGGGGVDFIIGGMKWKAF